MAEVLDGVYDVVAGPNGVEAQIRYMDDAQLEFLRSFLDTDPNDEAIKEKIRDPTTPDPVVSILKRIINNEWTRTIVQIVLGALLKE